ncbi:hypothetical protein [Brucella anthropi]|uniref:hypothetical protein n=1 Tax=Brucella anthropi TaxID=529 RepID=UPI00124E6978|nr:hypothetical protein [Brucella anthropi]KAB2724145.1 hypothetical protein F9K76_20265 [Brucella anthropi]KAB2739678.1 hypothetical protein F9K74_18420 [Brucella anthropi]KAB2802037.1 hypothetical protein F9K83_18415 [Brucella anthropi]
MSLARAIRAAVGGGRSMKSRLEEEKPEDLEDEPRPEDEAEGEDDPDPQAEGDDEPIDADEDEPVSEDDKDQGEFARGRRAERKRMSTILGSSHADSNPSLAAHLAFSTGMSAKAAIGTLKASGASGSGKPSLSSRMNGRVPALGNGGSKSAPRTGDERLMAFANNRAEARRRK